MLTARSDGYKCLPFVLLPRKRIDPAIVKKYQQKLILSWNGRVWMDNKIIEEYLKSVFGQGFMVF